MSHLFLGRDVKGLAGAPFVGDYAGNYQCKGKEVGMKLFSNASILVLSNIQAHVGGDALAVIGALALGKEKKKRQLAIDLGTNAEIILNDRENFPYVRQRRPAFGRKRSRLWNDSKSRCH